MAHERRTRRGIKKRIQAEKSHESGMEDNTPEVLCMLDACMNKRISKENADISHETQFHLVAVTIQNQKCATLSYEYCLSSPRARTLKSNLLCKSIPTHASILVYCRITQTWPPHEIRLLLQRIRRNHKRIRSRMTRNNLILRR
jgi:hypothetical protein